jgi:hypothetical protein
LTRKVKCELQNYNRYLLQLLMLLDLMKDMRGKGLSRSIPRNTTIMGISLRHPAARCAFAMMHAGKAWRLLAEFSAPGAVRESGLFIRVV